MYTKRGQRTVWCSWSLNLATLQNWKVLFLRFPPPPFYVCISHTVWFMRHIMIPSWVWQFVEISCLWNILNGIAELEDQLHHLVHSHSIYHEFLDINLWYCTNPPFLVWKTGSLWQVCELSKGHEKTPPSPSTGLPNKSEPLIRGEPTSAL